MSAHSLPEVCATSTSFNGEVVCPACTKLTKSRSGVQLLDFLPDCYVDSRGSVSQSTASEYVESRVAEEKLCDECVEDTSTTSKCDDCNAVLCDAHATSHPRLRAPYKHNVHKLTSQCEISRSAEHQPAQSCGCIQARLCSRSVHSAMNCFVGCVTMSTPVITSNFVSQLQRLLSKPRLPSKPNLDKMPQLHPLSWRKSLTR